MKEIHEMYYNPPAVNPDYVRRGIDEGLKYPEVSTCLTVTWVWTGAHDVMVGAHLGLMDPAYNLTSCGYRYGKQSDVRKSDRRRGRVSATSDSPHRRNRRVGGLKPRRTGPHKSVAGGGSTLPEVGGRQRISGTLPRTQPQATI
jgi:hypothetical protein